MQSKVKEIKEVLDNLLSLSEDYAQSSAEYFGKKYGNYKKRQKNNPEYNISKGNAEREQNIQNRYNEKAKLEDSNSSNYQRYAIKNFKDILANYKAGKMSKEEFTQSIRTAGKNIRKYSPGATSDLTSAKYKKSKEREDNFKSNALRSKNPS